MKTPMGAALGRRWYRVVLLALGISGIVAPAVAQTSVTLEWDANPEPSVAGYIVYVGNETGHYREQYDVGDTTSFVYSNVVPGTRYYFAVAAYESTHTVGPRSDEVPFLSGVAFQQAAQSPSLSSRIAPAETRTSTSNNATPRTVCPAGSRCYVAEPLAEVAGYAKAVTGTPDGRIFFVQDERSIRVVDAAGLIDEPALIADAAGVTFADMVLDAQFARTRIAYVAEVVTRADRGRELNIARYREVGNVFGERAVIIAGLPMSPSGAPALAVDSSHRLYVALPADQFLSDPYEGMVLRFENDGSVPDGNRAHSPVFARGYAEPVSLEWDAARGALWLSGRSAGAQAPIARLPVDDGAPERLSSALSAGNGAGHVVLIDNGRGVVHISVQADRTPAVGLISSIDLGGEPTSAASRGGEIYLSLFMPDANSSPISQILRLRQD